jgi:hypothetical protein
MATLRPRDRVPSLPSVADPVTVPLACIAFDDAHALATLTREQRLLVVEIRAEVCRRLMGTEYDPRMFLRLTGEAARAWQAGRRARIRELLRDDVRVTR